MPQLEYNGVKLPACLHTNFQMMGVYDESQTNMMYTKYDITVQAVLNPAYAGAATASGKSPAEFMNSIQQRLLTPRKTLQVTASDGTVLVPQTTGTIDAKNGPQPQYCQIFNLTNNTYFLIYRVVAHYVVDSAVSGGNLTAQKGNGVISNRWTEEVELDNCLYTTKTRSGVYYIRSDNPTGNTADFYRSQMAVVALPTNGNFIRKQSKYSVSPDGLSVRYSVTDQQVFRLPPKPAYEADGEYRESVTKHGTVRMGTCRVRLKGRPDVRQSDLLISAIQIARQKINNGGTPALGRGKNGFSKLENCIVASQLYKNEVEVIMECMFQPRTNNSGTGRWNYVAGLRFDLNLTSDPLGSQPGVALPLDYPIGGPANYVMHAAKYFDPLLQQQVVIKGPTSNLNSGTEPGSK